MTTHAQPQHNMTTQHPHQFNLFQSRAPTILTGSDGSRAQLIPENSVPRSQRGICPLGVEEPKYKRKLDNNVNIMGVEHKIYSIEGRENRNESFGLNSTVRAEDKFSPYSWNTAVGIDVSNDPPDMFDDLATQGRCWVGVCEHIGVELPEKSLMRADEFYRILRLAMHRINKLEDLSEAYLSISVYGRVVHIAEISNTRGANMLSLKETFDCWNLNFNKFLFKPPIRLNCEKEVLEFHKKYFNDHQMVGISGTSDVFETLSRFTGAPRSFVEKQVGVTNAVKNMTEKVAKAAFKSSTMPSILVNPGVNDIIVAELRAIYGSIDFVPGRTDEVPHPFHNISRKAVLKWMRHLYPRCVPLFHIGGSFEEDLYDGAYHIHSCFKQDEAIDKARYINKVTSVIRRSEIVQRQIERKKNGVAIGDVPSLENPFVDDVNREQMMANLQSDNCAYWCNNDAEDCNIIPSDGLSFAISVDVLFHIEPSKLAKIYLKKKVLRATHAITIPPGYHYTNEGSLKHNEGRWWKKNDVLHMVFNETSHVYTNKVNLINFYLTNNVIVGEDFIIYCRVQGRKGPHIIIDHFILPKNTLLNQSMYSAIFTAPDIDSIIMTIPIIDVNKPVSLLYNEPFTLEPRLINIKFMERLRDRLLQPCDWESLQISAAGLKNTQYISLGGFSRLFTLSSSEVADHCVIAYWMHNRKMQAIAPLVKQGGAVVHQANWWTQAFVAFKNVLKEFGRILDVSEEEELNNLIANNNEGQLRIEQLMSSASHTVRTFETVWEFGSSCTVVEAMARHIDLQTNGGVPDIDDYFKGMTSFESKDVHDLCVIDKREKPHYFTIGCQSLNGCPHDHTTEHIHQHPLGNSVLRSCNCCGIDSTLYAGLCSLCGSEPMCIGKDVRCPHEHGLIHDECCGKIKCVCQKPYHCRCCKKPSRLDLCNVCLDKKSELEGEEPSSKGVDFKEQNESESATEGRKMRVAGLKQEKKTHFSNSAGKLVWSGGMPGFKVDYDICQHKCPTCKSEYAHVKKDKVSEHEIAVDECPKCGNPSEPTVLVGKTWDTDLIVAQLNQVCKKENFTRNKPTITSTGPAKPMASKAADTGASQKLKDVVAKRNGIKTITDDTKVIENKQKSQFQLKQGKFKSITFGDIKDEMNEEFEEEKNDEGGIDFGSAEYDKLVQKQAGELPITKPRVPEDDGKELTTTTATNLTVESKDENLKGQLSWSDEMIEAAKVDTTSPATQSAEKPTEPPSLNDPDPWGALIETPSSKLDDRIAAVNVKTFSQQDGKALINRPNVKPGMNVLDRLSEGWSCLYVDLHSLGSVTPVSIIVKSVADVKGDGLCGAHALAEVCDIGVDNLCKILEDSTGTSEWWSLEELGMTCIAARVNVIIGNKYECLAFTGNADHNQYAVICNLSEFTGEEHWQPVSADFGYVCSPALMARHLTTLRLTYMVNEMLQTGSTKQYTDDEIMTMKVAMDPKAYRISQTLPNERAIKTILALGGNVEEGQITMFGGTFDRKLEAETYIRKLPGSKLALTHPTGFGKTTNLHGLIKPLRRKLIITPNRTTVIEGSKFMNEHLGIKTAGRAQSQWFPEGINETSILQCDVIMMTVDAAYIRLKTKSGTQYFANRMIFLDEIHMVTPEYVAVARYLGNRVSGVMSATIADMEPSLKTAHAVKTVVKLCPEEDLDYDNGTYVVFPGVDDADGFTATANSDKAKNDPNRFKSYTSKSEKGVVNVSVGGGCTNSVTTGATIPNVKKWIDLGQRKTVGIKPLSSYKPEGKNRSLGHCFDVVEYTYSLTDMLQSRGRVGRTQPGTFIGAFPGDGQPLLFSDHVKYSVMANLPMPEYYRYQVHLVKNCTVEIPDEIQYLETKKELIEFINMVKKHEFMYHEAMPSYEDYQRMMVQVMRGESIYKDDKFMQAPLTTEGHVSIPKQLTISVDRTYNSVKPQDGKCERCSKHLDNFGTVCCYCLYGINMLENQIFQRWFGSVSTAGGVTNLTHPSIAIDETTDPQEIVDVSIVNLLNLLCISINTLAGRVRQLAVGGLDGHSSGTFTTKYTIVNGKLKLSNVPNLKKLSPGEIAIAYDGTMNKACFVQYFKDSFVCSSKLNAGTLILSHKNNNYFMGAICSLAKTGCEAAATFVESLKTCQLYSGPPGSGKTTTAMNVAKVHPYYLVTKNDLMLKHHKTAITPNQYANLEDSVKTKIRSLVIDEIHTYDLHDLLALGPLQDKVILATGDANQKTGINDNVLISTRLIELLPPKEEWIVFDTSHRFGPPSERVLQQLVPSIKCVGKKDMGYVFRIIPDFSNESIVKVMEGSRCDALYTITNAGASKCYEAQHEAVPEITTLARTQGCEWDYTTVILAGVPNMFIKKDDLYVGLSRHRVQCTVVIEATKLNHISNLLGINLTPMASRPGDYSVNFRAGFLPQDELEVACCEWIRDIRKETSKWVTIKYSELLKLLSKVFKSLCGLTGSTALLQDFVNHIIKFGNGLWKKIKRASHKLSLGWKLMLSEIEERRKKISNFTTHIKLNGVINVSVTDLHIVLSYTLTKFNDNLKILIGDLELLSMLDNIHDLYFQGELEFADVVAAIYSYYTFRAKCVHVNFPSQITFTLFEHSERGLAVMHHKMPSSCLENYDKPELAPEHKVKALFYPLKVYEPVFCRIGHLTAQAAQTWVKDVIDSPLLQERAGGAPKGKPKLINIDEATFKSSGDDLKEFMLAQVHVGLNDGINELQWIDETTTGMNDVEQTLLTVCACVVGLATQRNPTTKLCNTIKQSFSITIAKIKSLIKNLTDYYKSGGLQQDIHYFVRSLFLQKVDLLDDIERRTFGVKIFNSDDYKNSGGNALSLANIGGDQASRSYLVESLRHKLSALNNESELINRAGFIVQHPQLPHMRITDDPDSVFGNDELPLHMKAIDKLCEWAAMGISNVSEFLQNAWGTLSALGLTKLNLDKVVSAFSNESLAKLAKFIAGIFNDICTWVSMESGPCLAGMTKNTFFKENNWWVSIMDSVRDCCCPVEPKASRPDNRTTTQEVVTMIGDLAKAPIEGAGKVIVNPNMRPTVCDASKGKSVMLEPTEEPKKVVRAWLFETDAVNSQESTPKVMSMIATRLENNPDFDAKSTTSTIIASKMCRHLDKSLLDKPGVISKIATELSDRDGNINFEEALCRGLKIDWVCEHGINILLNDQELFVDVDGNVRCFGDAPWQLRGTASNYFSRLPHSRDRSQLDLEKIAIAHELLRNSSYEADASSISLNSDSTDSIANKLAAQEAQPNSEEWDRIVEEELSRVKLNTPDNVAIKAAMDGLEKCEDEDEALMFSSKIVALHKNVGGEIKTKLDWAALQQSRLLVGSSKYCVHLKKTVFLLERIGTFYDLGDGLIGSSMGPFTVVLEPSERGYLCRFHTVSDASNFKWAKYALKLLGAGGGLMDAGLKLISLIKDLIVNNVRYMKDEMVWRYKAYRGFCNVERGHINASSFHVFQAFLDDKYLRTIKMHKRLYYNWNGQRLWISRRNHKRTLFDCHTYMVFENNGGGCDYRIYSNDPSSMNGLFTRSDTLIPFILSNLPQNELNSRGGDTVSEYFRKFLLRTNSSKLSSDVKREMVKELMGHPLIIGTSAGSTLNSSNFIRDYLEKILFNEGIEPNPKRENKEIVCYVMQAGSGKTTLKNNHPELFLDIDELMTMNDFTALNSLNFSYRDVMVRYQSAVELNWRQHTGKVWLIHDPEQVKRVPANCHIIWWTDRKVVNNKWWSDDSRRSVKSLVNNGMFPVHHVKSWDMQENILLTAYTQLKLVGSHERSKPLSLTCEAKDCLTDSSDAELFYSIKDVSTINNQILPKEGSLRVRDNALGLTTQKFTLLGALTDVNRPTVHKMSTQLLNATTSRLFGIEKLRKQWVSTEDYFESLSSLLVPNWRDMVVDFQREIIKANLDDTISWLEMKGHALEHVQRMVALSRDRVPSFGATNARMHYKVENLMKEQVNSVMEQIGRVIVWHEHHISMVICPLINHCKRRFKLLLNPLLITYTDGLDMVGLNLVSRTIKKSKYVIEMDLSKQDRQTDRPILMAEQELLSKLGLDTTIINYLGEAHDKFLIRADNGIRAIRDGMRWTGGEMTALGNEFRNCLILADIFNYKAFNHALTLGDDSLIFTDELTDEEVISKIAATRHNVKATLETKTDSGIFLQLICSWIGDKGYVFCANIDRLTEKYSVMKHELLSPEHFAKSWSYLMMIGPCKETIKISDEVGLPVFPALGRSHNDFLIANSQYHNWSFAETQMHLTNLIARIHKPTVRQVDFLVLTELKTHREMRNRNKKRSIQEFKLNKNFRLDFHLMTNTKEYDKTKELGKMLEKLAEERREYVR